MANSAHSGTQRVEAQTRYKPQELDWGCPTRTFSHKDVAEEPHGWVHACPGRARPIQPAPTVDTPRQLLGGPGSGAGVALHIMTILGLAWYGTPDTAQPGTENTIQSKHRI